MKKHMILPSLMILAGYTDARPTYARRERFVKDIEPKKCFRKDCDNPRGERGLYCSAECHRIDS
jgi:hypothetical protein